MSRLGSLLAENTLGGYPLNAYLLPEQPGTPLALPRSIGTMGDLAGLRMAIVRIGAGLCYKTFTTH